MTDDNWLPRNSAEHSVDALTRHSLGVELYIENRSDDVKRALLLDALCLLLLTLVWAASSRGSALPARSQQQEQSQQQQQSQSQSQSQSSGQGSGSAQSQAPSSSSAQDKDTKDKSAGDKAATDKPKKKKVYTEEDLSNLKGGVSVVGDGNARGDSGSRSGASFGDSGNGSSAGDARKNDEKSWRDRAAQIHQQIDATDDEIKALKEDIKKNGGSSFDAQSGLQQNRVYIVDKNAKVDNLEKKKKALEQKLDDLQEEGRKAGVPSDWVR